MDECEADEQKRSAPIQKMQQPQPLESPKDEGLSARVGLLSEGGSKPGRKEEGKKDFDDARFTAGIVRFYEAVLKEPIPEQMLHLIDKIANRERES